MLNRTGALLALLLFPGLAAAEGFTANCKSETKVKYVSSTTLDYEEVDSVWTDINKAAGGPSASFKEKFSFDGETVSLPLADFYAERGLQFDVTLVFNNDHALMFTTYLAADPEGASYNNTFNTYVFHKGNNKLIITKVFGAIFEDFDRANIASDTETLDCKQDAL